jgi:hypothetical protein
MNIQFASVISQAEKTFLRPSQQCAWVDIVRGTVIRRNDGTEAQIIAVGSNTFRGFHRLDKDAEGPQETFVNYFVAQKQSLLDALAKVKTVEQMHTLSNKVREALIRRLSNISPAQLKPYNKVRKPIDLYFEHLVSLARELESLRKTLVPLLSLPLDSWILNHSAVFSEAEMKGLGLSRGLTYGDIATEDLYLALQRLAQNNASIISKHLGNPFHPIYYDLFWRDRLTNGFAGS